MFRRFGSNGASSIKRVRLATHFRTRRTIPENAELTDRERVVTELARRGLRNQQIAECLGTTEEAVKNYLRRIFNKTGMGESFGASAMDKSMINRPASLSRTPRDRP